MYKIGDIIPYYTDWDSPNPQIIEGYGKLIKRLDDDTNNEVIYDEMPEAKQEIYHIQKWQVEVGMRKRTVSEKGLTVNKVVSECIVRRFSVLKQIGIHNKNNNTVSIRNKFNFKESHVAKMKNLSTNKVSLVVLNKDDMYRIYNPNSTNYEYRPILLDKRTKKFVDNDKFRFDSVINIHFKTIECVDNCDDCPIDWKPKYIHQAQEIYKIMTGLDLNIDINELKKSLKYESKT